jgi:hypothetical protein
MKKIALTFMALVLFPLFSSNSWAQKVVFEYEEYTGGANYLWMFNGDMHSVNSSRSHHHILITVECANADCSQVKLIYNNREVPESYETQIASQKLQEILSSKERVIKYISETRDGVSRSWNAAINLDGPGTGLWIPLGLFLTLIAAPVGAVQDLYNYCHGDGACKVQLRKALTQMEGLRGQPDKTVTIPATWPEVRDLARFVMGVGERISPKLAKAGCNISLEPGIASSALN